VRFGGVVALDGVTIDARPGHITGLIGPNGAGKTTLFNVCGGFLTPVRGVVRLDGDDITTASPAARARLGIGRTFQRIELFSSLTVSENVALAADAVHIGRDPLAQLGLTRRRRRDAAVDDLLARCGISEIAGVEAGALSTGQARLVELARALARAPRLLLLDEPSAGLDPDESAVFGELLADLVRRDHIGVLMIEHDIDLVLRYCDRIHVLEEGRLLLSGTAPEVASSDAVRAAYLGVT
jgi:ABC-type branched-subunit amino acid transport system ATPase component